MCIHSYDSIITIENLLLTWERFLCGKRNRKDVIQFQAELGANLAQLHYNLKDKTYIHGRYTAFNISDPKPRIIHKASVRDRVVHHLLYKELYWYFHPRLIYDSYSCRLGKGTHKALNRLRAFAYQVSDNHTRSCFVLKCDIKKFFASINHALLMRILKRHIADPDIRWLISQVVASFSSTASGVGLPLGNLTSQLLVNIYMNEFDRYVKQTLRVKYYLRYADDFVILSHTREYLEKLLPVLSAFLSEYLDLSLHEYKVSLQRYSSGVDFLGWVHFPHYRQIRTSTKRRIVKKIKHHPTREIVNSYRGLLRHGDTWKLRKRLGIID